MTQHLQREIEHLKRKLLGLSALVEESVYKATKAVAERDTALAYSVIESDDNVDMQEVEVEEECLKVLALHQPVATDLRFIVSVLKINNDLERIGDLAVNIAWRAESLAKMKKIQISLPLDELSSRVKGMLRKSLESLINLDVMIAREVCGSDDYVDDLNREIHKKIQDEIAKRPEEIEALLYMISVSRNLERIADHATNIAEDVIYFVEGDIVRHGVDREKKNL